MLPDDAVAVVYCASVGGNGQVVYSGKEGIGIQLLPVAETSPCPAKPANTGANHGAHKNTQTTH